MRDVVIIGCGIVGAACAYELSKYKLSVLVLEKENDVAAGVTKANSAIIHAGYDPQVGSLMAKLNVRGAELAREWCEALDVVHNPCGALVLAFSDQEITVLEGLMQNGNANGVPGLEILQREQCFEHEPNISQDVVAALHVPTTMIVSPWEYALALTETAIKNGAELKLECKVTAIDKVDGGYKLSTTQGEVCARYILNAAGLSADKVHNMAAKKAFEIIPDKGEYYLLDKSEGERVGHVVFQCPNKHGKGVLVAPTVHGNLIVGPSNGQPNDIDDVSTTAQGLAYVMQTARRAVPGIDFKANIRNFAGNRSKTEHDDFIIGQAEGAPGFVDVAGIKSPGLSAAPAIAELAVGILADDGLELSKKDNFYNERKMVRFHKRTPSEKAELVKSDSAYGRIICRCEVISEGEIRDALNSLIPPRSVDAVKRRCGAGMGRCQGGFCSPLVVDMLAKHYGCSPIEIPQDGVGTYILTSETKMGVNTK